MTPRLVELPGSLVLVPGRNLAGRLDRAVPDHPHLPSNLQQLETDLDAMTAAGGVPAIVSDPRDAGGDQSLLVYGRTYVLRLFPTSRRDGYVIATVNPLRLTDHHQLAAGCLKLRPTQWETRFEIRQIPHGVEGYWPQIRAEWADCLAAARSRPGTTAVASGAPRHLSFLDTLGRLIDATQQIRTEAMTPGMLYPYREVTATGERRHGTHAVYEFRLAGGQAPDEGAFVQVHGEPGQRGQVTRVTEGTQVTVRFDMPIDWARISQQGRLEPTPGSVVFDKQREAVAALRTGQARNPALLSVLVDHQVASIKPARDEPSEELDEDQIAAFRSALGVQDMLLVQISAKREHGHAFRETRERALGDLAGAQQEVDTVTRDDPAVRAALTAVEAAARCRGECRAAAVGAATAVSEALRGIEAPPFVRDQGPETTEEELAPFSARAASSQVRGLQDPQR